MSIVGEVDILTVPVIDLEVRRLCRSAPLTLVVDLTGVMFLDAAGLSLLLDTYRRTQLAEIGLRLVAPPRIVRLLGITGLAQIFSLHDSVSQAMEPARDSPQEPARDLTAPSSRSSVDDRRGALRLVES